jgi:hypothetical protein
MITLDCAKTDSKPKTQMGIPFAYKHANSAGFYDHQNQTATTTKKPKRGKRYAFSFKTLSDLDLPPFNEQLGGGNQHTNQNSQSNYPVGEENHELDRHSLDFLGRSISESVASEAPGGGSKSRLTEKLIASLGAENQKPALLANVTRATP